MLSLILISYAQIWIPFNSTEIARKCWYDNAMGTFRVVILAHSEKDFPAIREAVSYTHLPRKAILTYINNQVGAQVAEGSQVAIISDLKMCIRDSHFLCGPQSRVFLLIDPDIENWHTTKW